MAPMGTRPNHKRSQNPSPDPNGMFAGMTVFLVDHGVQPRRLQIWKERLEQMGAVIEGTLSQRVTHVFATSWDALKQQVGRLPLAAFNGKVLVYQWLVDSLSSGEKVAEDLYILRKDLTGVKSSHKSPQDRPADVKGNSPGGHETPYSKKLRSSSPEVPKDSHVIDRDSAIKVELVSPMGSSELSGSQITPGAGENAVDSPDKSVRFGTIPSSLKILVLVCFILQVLEYVFAFHLCFSLVGSQERLKGGLIFCCLLNSLVQRNHIIPLI
ncbi:hypothetical protein Dimus_012834 [Dionaea muscipula]